MDGPLSEAALWRPIATYATAIDTKDFELMAEVFHRDGVADYGERRLHGPAEVAERMRYVHQHLVGSRHRLTNFRIVGNGADGAVRTETYVDAFLVGGRPEQRLTYRDVGTYHDEIVEHHGRALIVTRRYERLWREGDVEAVIALSAPR